jgi:hypothetical protein
MRAKNLQRLLGLLVLGALVLAIGSTTAHAAQPTQQLSQYVEYPFGQGYQNNADYIYNMRLVLQNIGDGTNAWVIPAKSIAHYNALAGSMNESDGYRIVYGTPGGGACDVATWFYHVANDSGIVIAHANRLDHPKIYGVPLPAVTIWNPGSDLAIVNDNDFDVTIHWDLDSHPGYIRLWIDRQAGLSVLPSVQSTPVAPQPIVKAPLDPKAVIESLRWDIVGYICSGCL